MCSASLDVIVPWMLLYLMPKGCLVRDDSPPKGLDLDSIYKALTSFKQLLLKLNWRILDFAPQNYGLLGVVTRFFYVGLENILPSVNYTDSFYENKALTCYMM